VKRKKLSGVLAVLFLIQVISLPQYLNAETFSLNPASRISEPSFQQISTAVCLAVLFYKQDVLSPVSRQDIISGFTKLNGGDVRFDIRKIARDGLVSLYPVTIAGRDFLIRIFLSAKDVEPPPVKILFEIKIDNPPVTCQILPSINDILKSCEIKPHKVYSTHQVEISP
jgi:hypothetical protein